MKVDIEKVVSFYYERYIKIFNDCYPAHGSTGFTERNLSVNFAYALESLDVDSFAWFEFPIGEKQHIDAVIINKASNEVFIIEAKRFQFKSKVVSSANDISRITNEVVLEKIKDRLPKHNDYNFYCVILADVWLENHFKEEIYNFWGDGFYKKISEEFEFDIEPNLLETLSDVYWYKLGFNEHENLDEYLKKDYKLLIMLGKIKDN